MSQHRHRFGPVTQHVAKSYHDGLWPWLSPKAYYLLIDIAMETDYLEAMEADPLGGSHE